MFGREMPAGTPFLPITASRFGLLASFAAVEELDGSLCTDDSSCSDGVCLLDSPDADLDDFCDPAADCAADDFAGFSECDDFVDFTDFVDLVDCVDFFDASETIPIGSGSESSQLSLIFLNGYVYNAIMLSNFRK